MTYHFVVHPEDGHGFWGECVELDSCVSEGSTMKELKKNLKEALEGVLKVSFGKNFTHPLPDKTLDTNKDLLQVEVSPDVAFTVLLRHYRISHRLTQDTVSKMLRFKNRNSYMKLETAGNRTLRTVGKIRETFPDFPLMKCF